MLKPRPLLYTLMVVPFFLCSLFVYSQQNIEIQDIITNSLKQIKYWQQYPPKGMATGLLPVYRVNAAGRSKAKIDNSAFFTGLVINILRECAPKMNEVQRDLVMQIGQKAQPAMAKFKHPKGKPTYFFWPADTPVYFPNSLLGKVAPKKRYIPDDADDTVILLEATQASLQQKAQAWQYLQLFTANQQYWAKATLPAYSSYPAYSTWLGRGMPVDFDICVHANILRFAAKNQLPHTAADTATVALMAKMIANNHHITHASIISPHYGHPAIIHYHLARLMQVSQWPALDSVKPKLVAFALQQWRWAQSTMEALLWQLALLHWGQPVNNEPPFAFRYQDLNNDPFPYFKANIAAYLPYARRRHLDSFKPITFYFYCPAFNHALLIEYLMEWQKSQSPAL